VRIVVIVAVLASCTRDVRDREARPVAAPIVVDAPTRAPITRLSVRNADILCMHDAGSAHCVELSGGMDPTGKTVERAPVPDLTLELVNDGSACTWRSDRLACDGAAPIDNVQLVDGESQRYLQGSDRVWFVDPPKALHAMQSFPGGVRQLALGFMTGCALAGDGTVWCWSDPSRPRKIATPPRVADIAIVDPFALCMRTESGAVHCTPTFVSHEPFACTTHGFSCGSGGIEGPITHLFDPLVALTRPLQPLGVAEPVRTLVGDNGRLFTATIDNVVPDPAPHFGGCVLGASGALACFAMCEHGWGVVRVTGLPAISKLSPDPTSGYALAVDGTVWTWLHTCTGDVAATKVALPPVAQLAEPIDIRVGPAGRQVWTRCVLTRAGDVSCWTADGVAFDPR
jgi:hypothetical protein